MNQAAGITTPQTQRTFPLATYELWGERGDGHPETKSPVDHVCGSAEATVPLSREVAVPRFGLALVRTRLVKWPFEVAYISVTVDLREGEDVVSLTPAEARRVGTALIELADRAV